MALPVTFARPSLRGTDSPMMGCLIAGASIFLFIRLFLPGMEGAQRLFAQQRNHRNSARRSWQLKLGVNICVIKADRCGVRGEIRVKHAIRARPVNCAEAHRARLTSCVDIAAGQFEILERLAGGADCYDFSMRRRIICRSDAVGAFSDDFSILRYDCAKGPAAIGAHILEREFDRAAHAPLVNVITHENMPPETPPACAK